MASDRNSDDDIDAMADKLLNEFLQIPRAPSPLALAGGNYKLTTIGKLFFASLIANMMTGKRSPFKVSGSPHDIELLSRAVQSSKRFQDEIRRPGATVDSVIRAMDLKNVDASNFYARFGVKWPL